MYHAQETSVFYFRATCSGRMQVNIFAEDGRAVRIILTLRYRHLDKTQTRLTEISLQPRPF